MGAFSNINVRNLENVVFRAKNEIKEHNFSRVIQSLSNSATLSSNAVPILNTIFSDISSNNNLNGSFVSLEKSLNQLLRSLRYIREIQELENDIHDLEKRRYKTVVDEDGDSHEELDQKVVSKIRAKKSEIKEKELKIRSILTL